jgi:Uma2 family endonuclease
MIPDLVVEVISANDHYSEIDAKVDRYLDDGVEIVLVIDPRQKTVAVRGRDLYKKLRLGDALTLGNIIPEFEMLVASIFE